MKPAKPRVKVYIPTRSGKRMKPGAVEWKLTQHMINNYTDIIPITPIRAAEHGGTITRKTFRLSTGGVMGRGDRAGLISGGCAILLSLHGRIDIETANVIQITLG
jgi:hypothetical protein